MLQILRQESDSERPRDRVRAGRPHHVGVVADLAQADLRPRARLGDRDRDRPRARLCRRRVTGGQKGLADLPLFTGIGLMGGAMLRDFAIVATAFEVQATEARKAGMIGVLSLLLGTVLPFIVGAGIAMRSATPSRSA